MTTVEKSLHVIDWADANVHNLEYSELYPTEDKSLKITVRGKDEHHSSFFILPRRVFLDPARKNLAKHPSYIAKDSRETCHLNYVDRFQMINSSEQGSNPRLLRCLRADHRATSRRKTCHQRKRRFSRSNEQKQK